MLQMVRSLLRQSLRAPAHLLRAGTTAAAAVRLPAGDRAGAGRARGRMAAAAGLLRAGGLPVPVGG